MTTNYSTSSPTTGSTDDNGAKDQAKQAAGTAAEETNRVAGVAKDEAHNVATEAKQQARGLLDDALVQVDEQSRTQRDRLVSTLQDVSSQLDDMASGEGSGPCIAQDLVRQVADKTRQLSTQMDGREPRDLLEDVRSFARRKPGTFLLGAMTAGLVAGRLTRGTKEANNSTASGTVADTAYDNPRGTAQGLPTAGTGFPSNPASSSPLDPAEPTLDTGADSPWTENPTNQGPV